MDTQLVFISFLQPTADGSLVTRILVVKVSLEKPFFSWDHQHHDEGGGGNEGEEQPKVIQPNRQSEQKQDERQVDGISSEPVRASSDDRSSAFGSPHRSASCAKFSAGKHEEQYGAKSNNGPEQPKCRWDEGEWPSKVQRDPHQNGGQKYNWGPEQAD